MTRLNDKTQSKMIREKFQFGNNTGYIIPAKEFEAKLRFRIKELRGKQILYIDPYNHYFDTHHSGNIALDIMYWNKMKNNGPKTRIGKSPLTLQIPTHAKEMLIDNKIIQKLLDIKEEIQLISLMAKCGFLISPMDSEDILLGPARSLHYFIQVSKANKPKYITIKRKV